MRRASVAAFVAVMLVFAVFVARPWFARERPIPASVVSPAALRGTDAVKLAPGAPGAPGAPVCFAQASMESHSHRARFVFSEPAGGRSPRLRLTIRGRGYRSTVSVSGGFQEGQTASIVVPAPARDTEVRVCLRNLGRPETALLASSDRTRSRSLATVGGRQVLKSIWFEFDDAAPATIAQRLPLILQRATVFRPAYVTRPLLWVLALLFALGIPVAVIWAYAAALRADDRDLVDAADTRRRGLADRYF